MRFTVRRKIVFGVAGIVLLGMTSLFIVYQGLASLRASLRELDELDGPNVEAAYEMEINLVELAASVSRYMDGRDVGELEQIGNDRQDFEKFHDQYRRLQTSARGRELADRVAELYRESLVVADSMIASRDAESSRFAQVMRNIERIDDILDSRLERRVDRALPGAMQKLVDSIDLEADIGEVGIWLATYRRTRREHDRDLIWSNVEEFRVQAGRLRNNPDLTAGERRAVADVDATFRDTEVALQDVLAFDAQIVQQGLRFEALRRQLDDMLDDEIQVLAIGGLDQPIIDADTAVRSVARRAAVILPLLLLSAGAVAGLLIMSLTRPVTRLVAGTEAVRRGDLGARIAVRGRDELSDLAVHFNQMVARLEATTVSKTALEESDTQLRRTNEVLRQQIADRERAEAAEKHLRGELHRNEMLARMGSLVAGVAHEARNPLFGISSTVDAIEARLTRLGTQATYADHLTVLRREITRLNALTRDLLEYGKPSGVRVSPGRLDDVLVRAIQACRTLSEKAGVRISTQVAPGVGTLMLDADRMVQVFQNLVENAIHHSPRGGTVTVNVQPPGAEHGAWVTCEVIDQGEGVNAEDLPRIFEPFFTRRARGTGLGLSIVERIVDHHGGKVTARNAAGGGAILTVALPAGSGPAANRTGDTHAVENSRRR